jgi:hypothetical protein
MNVLQWTGLMFYGSTMQILGHLNESVARDGLHAMNAAVPNDLLDPATYTYLHQMKIISNAEYNSYMIQLGLDAKEQENISIANENHLSPVDLISLWRRKKISDDQLKSLLAECKILDNDIQLAKDATEFFPTPSDLISFAVREVYSADTVNKFKTDEDLPPQFLTEAEKAGLPVEQAKNYWRAHWQLPSAGQGFEMFQRGILSLEDLVLLLKDLDIMPYFRDKLIQINYNPLTRVDVRRMYAVGELTEEEVKKSFQDAGYSPENAERLKNFTLKYDNPEIDGITRASIVTAYKKGLIDKAKLSEYFKLLNYTPAVLNFWIENADYEKTLANIESMSADITQRYQMGILDENGARQELLSLDVPTTYVEEILQKEILSKAKRTKLPSLEDLKRWLTMQVIDEDYFTAKARGLGYQDIDIEKYLAEIANTIDTGNIKYLPIETYVRWVKSNIISPKRFSQILDNQGISGDKQNAYLTKAGVI